MHSRRSTLFEQSAPFFSLCRPEFTGRESSLLRLPKIASFFTNYQELSCPEWTGGTDVLLFSLLLF